MVLPTSGEKMNVRSSCGLFTFSGPASFGPVLFEFRKCHPSTARGLLVCQGGLRREMSCVPRSSRTPILHPSSRGLKKKANRSPNPRTNVCPSSTSPSNTNECLRAAGVFSACTRWPHDTETRARRRHRAWLREYLILHMRLIVPRGASHECGSAAGPSCPSACDRTPWRVRKISASSSTVIGRVVCGMFTGAPPMPSPNFIMVLRQAF